MDTIGSGNIGSGDDESVRQLAYRLWEEDGRPDGRQDEYWYDAERRLRPVPTEPADPHPADEDAPNVFNPAPGGDRASELRSADLEADPRNPGSPA